MSSEIVHIRRDADDQEGSPLHRRLAADVEGDVRFDRGTRALYATDASNYRQPPIGVVVPRTVDAALAALAICHEHEAAVLPRGGGTSLGGQCCNRAVVIDCSRWLTRVEVDPGTRTARVEPGVILDQLREAAAPHELDYGPDPATHSRCTLGGMLGNNSCGAHSLFAELYGPGARTSDQVAELDCATYDGVRFAAGALDDAARRAAHVRGGRLAEMLSRAERLVGAHAGLIRERFPDIPRRVSGYNLPSLLPERGAHLGQALVGSEATCVFIVGATLTLLPARPERAIVVLGFPDAYAAADAVPLVRAQRPIACEAIDHRLVAHVRKLGRHLDALELLPEGHAWLLVEHGAATAEEAHAAAERTARAFRDQTTVAVHADAGARHELWALREAGLGVTAFAPGERDTWPGWEDAAVPPDRLGAYLREFRRLLDQHGLGGAFYGHFGQGLVHTRIDFDLEDAAGTARFAAFTEDAARLVRAHGGTLSGEHGDGQARADLLGTMYGPEVVHLFEEWKAIWDPMWRMNPGKVVRPNPRTSDLRLRTAAHDPGEIQLHQQHDGKDFLHATIRCVGVGECRKREHETMCPSYMVTLEERYSTRGRARLLFEMMHGDVLERGWRSEAVREALDLCLACKACKHECPVEVDMAGYKAEFLYHHYRHRLRPLPAYAFGLVHTWLGLAARVPGLVNFLTQTPGLSAVAKRLGGIAPERQIPRLARTTFRRSFRRRHRGYRVGRGPRVILWVDTFNDAFYPEVLHAAVEVLVTAGYTVVVPRPRLCCGRALVEFGWLDAARRTMARTVRSLASEIRAGTPVVGIEPTCTVAFRDELLKLLPADQDARALSGLTVSLAELLARDPGYRPPALAGRVLHHGHCQQRAVLTPSLEQDLLRATGVDLEVLDSGCCGMAGSFGFERDKYALSTALANRRLIPAVRAAGPDAVVLADGFSCREQLRQLTGVRPLHLAEILAGRPDLAVAGETKEAEEPEAGRLDGLTAAADAFP